MTFKFTLFMIFSLYPLVFLLGEKGWDNTIERYLSFKSILPTEYFVPRFLWTTFISAILIYSAPSMWANNYEYQDYITGHEYVYSLPEKRQRQIFSILTKQQAYLTSRYGVTNTQEKVDAAAVLQYLVAEAWMSRDCRSNTPVSGFSLSWLSGLRSQRKASRIVRPWIENSRA